MTRNIIDRSFSRVAFGLAVCIAFFSCARENSLEDAPEIFLKETWALQKAFMHEYRECSLRSEAMRDSIFGFEGLKPQWQRSRSETTESGIRFIEVPLNADLAALPVSSSLSEHLDACEGKTLNLTYLIRKEHPTDSTRSLNYFISMMPSFKMLASGSSLDHRPGAVPEGFDGEVFFFNLTGELRHKYVYENGHLIGRYKAVYRPQMRMIMVDDCQLVRWEKDWYQYTVDADGNASEPKYTHTQYWYEVECTSRIVYITDSSTGEEYNGGSSGGGGGNVDNHNNESDDEKLKDPCENMKSKSTNKAFMDELDKLKELAPDSIEYGRAFTYDGTKFSFTTHNGDANEINYTPSQPIDGFIHTHNVDRGHSHIFTGDDLFSIYDCYIKGGINNIETFVFGLVTNKGCYFLKVTDVDAFNKFFSGKNHKDFCEYYNPLLVKLYRNQGPQQEAVDSFVYFLNTLKVGITLMERKDNGFHQKMIVDNEILDVSC